MPYRFRDSILPSEKFYFHESDLNYTKDRDSTSTMGTILRHHSNPGHKRTSSTPNRQTSSNSLISTDTSLLVRSLSDATGKPLKTASLACHAGGKRKSTAPVKTPSTSPKRTLSVITEQTEQVYQPRGYKVEAIDPASNERVIRSPMKKLFGEGGLLGQPDTTPTRKPHIVSQFAGRVKDHVSDFMSNLPNISLPNISNDLPSAPSTFPITLAPYSQGQLYMELELLLTVETNRFILHEFTYGRVSTDSVRKIVDIWRHKGRPQVIGFRYDLATQRDLVILNMDTMHFVGIGIGSGNGIGHTKLLSVLAAWKKLAKEISIRTFCQPDSAVKKHFWDAEKVLELVDASSDGMMAFQELRAKVLSDLYREERGEGSGAGSRSGSPVRK